MKKLGFLQILFFTFSSAEPPTHNQEEELLTTHNQEQDNVTSGSTHNLEEELTTHNQEQVKVSYNSTMLLSYNDTTIDTSFVIYNFVFSKNKWSFSEYEAYSLWGAGSFSSFA